LEVDYPIFAKGKRIERIKISRLGNKGVTPIVKIDSDGETIIPNEEVSDEEKN